MYVPHFAAALPAKSRAREAPIWALLIAAFLPELVWMVLARAGVEPAQQATFFDDSHSLLSIVVLSTLFAISFWQKCTEGGVHMQRGHLSHWSPLNKAVDVGDLTQRC
jgi:hypothetical protein